MRGRGQLLAAALVIAAVAAAAVGLERGVGSRAPAAAPAPSAPSGAWFCPHGGGAEWQATLEVANPGETPVQIRVTRMSERRPTPPRFYTVEPRSELLLPGAASSRAASSLVEYFGGWVAAGWVSHAGGGEGGVAAEPCAPTAGSRWLLPDGSTQLAEAAPAQGAQPELHSWVVVMNPFASDAVFSLTLYTDKDAPVRPGEWTRVDLKPFRARAFYLNDQRLGYGTVSTTVDAKVGRVVASTLDVSDLGGVRASLGQLAPPPADAVLPGGFDQGRTELIMMNTGTQRTSATGSVLGRKDPSPLAGPDEGQVNGESAQTFPITTQGPTALDLKVPAGAAVVRRTYGQASDQGATGPGVAARAWVILPAVAGQPSNAGVVVANPGQEDAEITLAYLPSGTEPLPAPITIRVAGLRTVAVPSEFVQARPLGAILAIASSGTFVPASASYSLGREGYAAYAVSLGVPVPDAWVPPLP
jgi:hypothetical protein